ncbi:hypothetical protein ONA70_16840 [Micromonospora yasonensis]|uniref:hypothetical protein n=1 Tax=Micromonospora yasonensis TaxID=1128667 RepID=UPI002231B060|nr:hypothetical protein [Micromonospora yasonensis]MCW3841769.1 hypothetical protein [Micromonospora yasonensis]
MKLLLWIGLPVLALVGLALAALAVAPAWRARSGDGTAGTFTARYEECGRSCTWHGGFFPDGAGMPRNDVIVYGEPGGLTSGATVAARDTGARRGVFAAAGGGNSWLLFSGLAVAGVPAAVGWVVMLVRAVANRRQTQRETTAGVAVAPTRQRPNSSSNPARSLRAGPSGS